MPTPILPAPDTNRVLGYRGVTWGLTKKPMFKTQTQQTLTGREAVQQSWSRPKYDIALKWSFLREQRSVVANTYPTAPRDEYRRLVGFFTARRGSFEPFFVSFTTDGDHVTSNELLVASTPAVAADPSNPDSRNYQFVRTFGGTVEPVGGVNVVAATPIVTLNPPPHTTPVTLVYNTDYTVNDPRDGWMRLASAPTTDSIIRATYHYYYRVAFARDDLEFEAFADDFWRLKSVNLRTRWW
jgi:hypothetical protein